MNPDVVINFSKPTLFSQAFHLKSSKALRLVCNGYYDEIVVVDPLNLEVVYSLVARVESDWISACSVISPPGRDGEATVAWFPLHFCFLKDYHAFSRIFKVMTVFYWVIIH